MKRWQVWVAFLCGFAAAFSCAVKLGDDRLYQCKTNSDCGTGGYACVTKSGVGGYCCKSTGPEVCDGIDNDCNGIVDDSTAVETCNGIDDNCNGEIDEGFDFANDRLNCGGCGKVCTILGDICSSGECIHPAETNCANGIDDDLNGKVDCADSSCNLQHCGAGCQCRSLVKAEANCTDSVDNDGDGKTDCADPDCAGAGCGVAGCVCRNLAKTETNCSDGIDNDGDGNVDCADSDCDDKLCAASPSTKTCSAGSCQCNGTTTSAETGAKCADHIDNDCNGLTDCAEASCDTISCGTSCVCGELVGHETNCADRMDNDGDGLTDCADSFPDGGGDCPTGIACSFLDGTGHPTSGHCSTRHLCE